ncbi:MAG: hypothetical protein HY551_02650 [Elusimicrobia bacterium]|nr:hypothetical protein [Elusimicrobiota bacterium]
MKGNAMKDVLAVAVCFGGLAAQGYATTVETVGIPKAEPVLVAESRAPIAILSDRGDYVYSSREAALEAAKPVEQRLLNYGYVTLRIATSHTEIYAGFENDARWRYEIFFIPRNDKQGIRQRGKPPCLDSLASNGTVPPWGEPRRDAFGVALGRRRPRYST